MLKKMINASPIVIALLAPFDVFLWAVAIASALTWLMNHVVLAGQLGLSHIQRIQCTLPYASACIVSVLVVWWVTPELDTVAWGHSVQAVLFAMLYAVINVLFSTGGFQLIIHHSRNYLKGLRHA